MSTDDLIARMAAVLFMGDRWCARARGSNVFHDGATPRDAMLAALAALKPVENADLF